MKIIVKNDTIEYEENNKIKIIYDINSETLINKLEIEIRNNIDFSLIFELDEEYKLDCDIMIKKGVLSRMFQFYKSDKSKIRYNYNVCEKANLKVERFLSVKDTQELAIIDLNGEDAIIDYQTNILNNGKTKIDVVVYHNYLRTTSNINHNGLNVELGSLKINVTTTVDNGIKKCLANQYNKVVNFTSNKCEINPILLISEHDVEANHSALIGNFDENEIFYLMSRGIDRQSSIKLLSEGLLLSNISVDENLRTQIKETINQDWR